MLTIHQIVPKTVTRCFVSPCRVNPVSIWKIMIRLSAHRSTRIADFHCRLKQFPEIWQDLLCGQKVLPNFYSFSARVTFCTSAVEKQGIFQRSFSFLRRKSLDGATLWLDVFPSAFCIHESQCEQSPMLLLQRLLHSVLIFRDTDLAFTTCTGIFYFVLSPMFLQLLFCSMSLHEYIDPSLFLWIFHAEDLYFWPFPCKHLSSSTLLSTWPLLLFFLQYVIVKFVLKSWAKRLKFAASI